MEKIKFVMAGEKIPHEKVYHYDLIILGGGAAGLASAIYASRYGLKAVVISRDIGGTANLAGKIENYPGFTGSGRRLMKKFYKQARKFGCEFMNDYVINLGKDSNGVIVAVSSKKIIHAKSIIIALGIQRKRLNIEGENRLIGKGVSYCATCDAYFFKNKKVAVIGAGDAACKASLLLSEIAKKVYIVYRSEREKCENAIIDKLRKKENVEFLPGSSPLKITGKDKVNGLIVKRDNKETEIKVEGVFIEIGGLPMSDIAKMLGIKLDKEEYIVVDENMNTSIEGVFAAGDAVKSKLKQVIVAASQGAVAAKSAYDFINEK